MWELFKYYVSHLTQHDKSTQTDSCDSPYILMYMPATEVNMNIKSFIVIFTFPFTIFTFKEEINFYVRLLTITQQKKLSQANLM